MVSALVAQGIKGLTVSDVYGIGFQGGVHHPYFACIAEYSTCTEYCGNTSWKGISQKECYLLQGLPFVAEWTCLTGSGHHTGKERYGGSEFGENDLIQKKKLDIVCVRYAPTHQT